MNKRYMIQGLDQYLNFIKLLMKKEMRLNVYSTSKSILYDHPTYLFGMLKSSIKLNIFGKQYYDGVLDFNLELNYFESNDNKVIFDSSEIFTKKFAKFNFYCTKEVLHGLTLNIIKPFGKQFKMSVEEYEKTHECHSGHMLQPPEKGDPNYKELMKEYWKEYNYLHS